MSSFKAYFDADKLLPNGLNDKDFALEMVSQGQKVLQNAVKQGASKHIKPSKSAVHSAMNKLINDKIIC